jgi:pyrroloquinoline quinone biosynthesis protein D
MQLEARPRRVDAVVWRRGDEGVVVLNPNDGNYFSLDDVGGRIWELCDGERSANEIATLLAGEYDASIADITRDMLELLHELQAEGLVADAA